MRSERDGSTAVHELLFSWAVRMYNIYPNVSETDSIQKHNILYNYVLYNLKIKLLYIIIYITLLVQKTKLTVALR